MFKFCSGFTAAFVLCGGLLTALPVQAEDRPADKILADIKAVAMPSPPANANNQAAIQDFMAKRQKAAEQKSDLIGELLKSHPDCPELPGIILERWQFVMMPGPKGEAMNAEVDNILAKSKNEKLVAEAAFLRAAIAFQKVGADADAEALLPIAETFVKKAPKDERGALFLGAVASKMTDPSKAAELNKRIEKEYPNSPVVKQLAAERKLKDAVGKPFPLAFKDAMTDKEVSIEGLKGKVVIIDFWATWCGPCVGEMPKMKELYAKYKPKGVEFIGVSLDQPKEKGGLDKLKAFVEKNKLEWPQYYQGNYWQSEFSSSWGINSIPAVFAVDADGNLATMDARGKLETLIPELLEKAEKSKKAAAKP